MMAALVPRRISRRLYSAAFGTVSTFKPKPPYWLTRFPDGIPRRFEDIPVVEEKNHDMRKYHEVCFQFYQKYGYVSKELMPDNSYLVHLFHFDDYSTIYESDGKFPERLSHRVMRCYREARPDLYENVGLGPGIGDEWWSLRKLLHAGVDDRILRPLQPALEEVADDLVKMLHIKAREGAIEVLPWLFRWQFEGTGVVALNKRLGALSEQGSEEADKMVEAAGITNEMIGLAEVDWMNFNQYLEKMSPCQDFMYSVIIKYVNDMAMSDNPNGAVKKLLQVEGGTTKNAVTYTMDIFQGALQTVPLTVLMCLYNLALNKQVQDKLRETVMKLLPSKDSRYFPAVKRFSEDVPRYLAGVVWETLRVNPPIIGNGRVLKQDLVLGGFQVPKGTNTTLHHQVTCMIAENFKDPHQFKPERHPSVHHAKMQYVFGATARMCSGRTFAVGQMAMVIAKIVRDFEVSYEGGPVTMINRLHNEPEEPLHLKFTPIV